jgi:uncharacterized protein YecE (DUF72 family)
MSARRAPQLDLFAHTAGPAAPPPSGIRPTPARPEHLQLAERLPASLRFGTSSWSYPGWAGILYEGHPTESALAREGLRAYSSHPLLRAINLDRTFYQPLRASDFQTYAEQVPADFRFVVKAHDHCTLSRFPTHARYGTLKGQENPRFLEPAYAAGAVVGPTVEGLCEKLGVLLFQVSPQDTEGLGGPQRFAERLHRFLSALPRGPAYAVELRNASLLTPEYAQVLRDCHACHVLNWWTHMPPIDLQGRGLPLWEAPAVVSRWILPLGAEHDERVQRFSPFHRLAEEDLRARHAFARLAWAATNRQRPAYVLVDNKAEGCAPESIVRLAEMIAAGPS